MRNLIIAAIIMTFLGAAVMFLPAQADNRKAISDLSPTPYIVVDQFGYLPELDKRAVLRSPKRGYDVRQRAYTPKGMVELYSLDQRKVVFAAKPIAWQGGAIHEKSGDQAWMFDFSRIKTEGRYVVRDPSNRIESYPFEINSNVYKDVLKQAFRTMFYQRAGFAKRTPYADRNYQDGASHLQDKQARSWFDKGNVATARDLHGGWYDAGDYNKYTVWTAQYVLDLLHAYEENPQAWGDNFNIPESGNRIPDILDEAKWGLDWLERMQNPDGSVLSVMALDEASPPSAATGPSYYGPISTTATLGTASAFAYAAKVYGNEGYKHRALRAYNWANKNPRVIFRNNEEGTPSDGLAAGQQEVDDEGRAKLRLQAAAYIFALTGNQGDGRELERLYKSDKFIDPYWFNPFEADITQSLLYASLQANAPRGFKSKVREDFRDHLKSASGLESLSADPYGAALNDYTWGSNKVKAKAGNLYMAGLWSGTVSGRDYINAGLAYVNYIHGLNPLGKTYLSNMGQYGAEDSVPTIYHAWFKDGTKFDDTRTGLGPAPGFLVGGPNPWFSVDKFSPPAGQPHMKAYYDFNDGWPHNSWEVSENSLGYQVAYLRLLSKFVR